MTDVLFGRFYPFFIAWLYLICGISQDKCQKAIRYIIYIVKNCRQLPQGIEIEKTIPKDIRTITRCLKLLAKFEYHVCCQSCYSLYEIEIAPGECGYRATPDSLACGEDLFNPIVFPSWEEIPRALQQQLETCQRNISHRTNPRSIFVSQRFTEWLKWLLCLPGVESSIDEWQEKLNLNAFEIIDYNHSNAFLQSISKNEPQNENSSKLQLSFSLFVNWFKPLGNKISGKQVSLGVLSLTCLNLPPTMQYKPQFTYLSGLIPAPNQPNTSTINSILKPLVDELRKLDQTINIQTFQIPNGRNIRIILAALIGEIVATHKVSGFAFHSAQRPCSWCEVIRKDLEKVTIGKKRNKNDTLGLSVRWFNEKAICQRKILAKKAGVRWSELNLLPYWDPSKDVVLGMMHNWYEGILQHHFWYRWGMNKISKNDFQTLIGGDLTEESTETSENNESSGSTIQALTNAVKEEILSLFSQVLVPSGLTRVPKGLGGARNGKLKASKWHSLFSIHLPLTFVDSIVKIETFDEDLIQHECLLNNFSSLVQCTNIISSKRVNEEYCQIFEEEYRNYTETSRRIFSNIKILPNHHYALHIPEQMRWWGPLSGVSEFAGERLVGILQNFKKNSTP
ncbi:hypothetical protein O181_007599, partial [Austropuccinia psidii MF-1]|nr:hypothetical protein [Austropuccinia psidii MF-1]